MLSPLALKTEMTTERGVCLILFCADFATKRLTRIFRFVFFSQVTENGDFPSTSVQLHDECDRFTVVQHKSMAQSRCRVATNNGIVADEHRATTGRQCKRALLENVLIQITKAVDH